MNHSEALRLRDAVSLLELRRRTGRVATALRPYGMALAIVGATTGVSELFFRLLGTNRLSMVFLVGVLVTAVTQGAYPAYLAAVTAFFVYNFYLVEPRFTIRFASAEDVIILIVFLGAAMLTGRLAGRLRDEAMRSKARAQTADALFKASRELSSTAEEDEMRQKLVDRIASAVGGDAILSDGARVWTAVGGLLPPEARLGASELAPSTRAASMDAEWQRGALTANDVDLGQVAWRPRHERGRSGDDDRLLGVLVDLGAAAIIRARLTAAKSEMEALTRTEQLRTALLSSISHDLRTPLAAILVSSSSLRDYGDRFDPDIRQDLVLTIHEEALRLNRIVENLLSITKLESGALVIGASLVDVADLIREVALVFERRGRARAIRAIDVDIEGADLSVTGDQVLLEQALGNLIENAIKFAPEDTAVVVRGRQTDTMVAIEVLDEGPGVPATDLDRIFEKFYRSAGTPSQLQGSGLGLSIAKGLVEAMRGSIEARARDDGRTGLSVLIRLPRREHND